MFILELNEVKSTMVEKAHKADVDIKLWHKRIGHINLNKLKGMQSKGFVIRLGMFKEKEMKECVELANSTSNITPVPEREEREQRPIERDPLGCVGTSTDATIRGCQYYVAFINNFSRHTWIFPMKQKSELFTHFQKIQKRSRNDSWPACTMSSVRRR